MDFALGDGSGNFPRVHLEHEFRDDSSKLHSDLVGLSLDDCGTDAGKDSAGLMSLQLQEEDPRKKKKKKRESSFHAPKQDDNFLVSALFCAVEEGDEEKLSKLLPMCSSVGLSNRRGESVVHVAAGLGKTAILQLLASRGADLTLADCRGDHPAIWAARQGHLDALKFLVERGVDINERNKSGESCLLVACKYCRTDVVSYLTDVVGAEVELDAQDENRQSALHLAARTGDSRIVNTLVKAGVSRALRNKDGETALHVACAQGHTDCAQMLVEAKSDVDAQDKWLNTPLHLAIRQKNERIATWLINAGADFDFPNCSGDLALHESAREGLLSVTQSLCALGCTVDVANNQGQLPLHLAAKNGSAELVRCLCLAGCRADAKNAEGVTPDLVALASGHGEVAQLLKRLKRDACCDEYIDQLIPSSQPISKLKLKLFGSMGAGKTSVFQSLRAGYFSGFFRRSRKGSARSRQRASIQDGGHTCKHIGELEISQEESTQGIEVHQCTLGVIGEVSVWEFSGDPNFHFVYDHFIGNVNCIHLLVFSLSQGKAEQLAHLRFWLTFLRCRIPPVEPLGDCGKSSRPARVVLIATHADMSVTSPRDAEAILSQVKAEFGHVFDLWPKVFVVDANTSNSVEMKALKQSLSDIKKEIVDGIDAKVTNVLAENDLILQGGIGSDTDLTYTLVTQREPELKGLPRTTRFLERVLSCLPDWRKTLAQFPVMAWQHFMSQVRDEINLLSADEHLKEVIQQLQLMGEVIYLKGDLSDVVVLEPNWLCHEVCGHLLSKSFRTSSRPTGSYTLEEFQLSAPQWEAMDLLPLVESLGICTRCQVGPDIEYEFPCYNRLSHPTDVWSPPVDDDLLHGGVLLKMSSTYCSSFSVMFPRFQALLRRHCNAKGDLAYDLSQWLRGSRITCYSQGEVEALVRLEEADQDAFEIRVRGGRVDARSCFFLLEEVLGVVDQVLLEMSPGMAVEKFVLSSRDIETFDCKPHNWDPSSFIAAILTPAGDPLSTKLQKGDDEESVKDLVCFGSNDVASLLTLGIDLHASSLSTLTRQGLCQLLDPQDPMGRDWCLLAVKMGLADKVPRLEGETKGQSQMAKILDEWEAADARNTIGKLIEILKDIGRNDAVKALARGCPFYRIKTLSHPDLN